MPFIAFDPIGNARLMRLTTFFGQIFFLKQRNTPYIKTQLYSPYSHFKNQIFGGCLFN